MREKERAELMEKSLKEEKLQEEKQIDKNVGVLHCTGNCCCFGCLLSAMPRSFDDEMGGSRCKGNN